MKQYGFLMLWALSIAACSHQPSKSQEPSSIDTVIQQHETIQQQETFFCPRGKATPVLNKEDYPNATFTIEEDTINATETTELPNGDKLTVRTWGCEYLVYTFKFETSHFSADTADLVYWYNAAGKLMTRMLGGTTPLIDLKKGIMHLGYYAVNNKSALRLGEEIDFSDPNGYRNLVTLDRVEELPNGIFTISISFAEGPL